ncbi:MAG: flavodoxin family protein [Deltaproteobacteria bacterium]|jgi:NAD(P)H dehydrogenase (quinone)|nr:flavodoxin family protein [Deltaproteobacteria bacterium]
MPIALVIYHSKSGHTKKMAEAISEGICKTEVSVTLIDVADAKVDDLLNADAIVLGSPTYYGTMAAEMKRFIDDTVKLHGKLQGKIGGAFSSSGMLGGGNETTVMSILEALLIHGMIVHGHSRIAHYGPIAVGDPDTKAIEECSKYGNMIGELILKLAK